MIFLRWNNILYMYVLDHFLIQISKAILSEIIIKNAIYYV